jgi:hypothetical protein
MALSVDWFTKVITIPQTDLSLIGGTLYEHDTEAFQQELKELEASEEGIVFFHAHDHNAPYTVAGVTYARKVELIDNYSITYENGAYTTRLAGSNNNLFDVESGILNQNNVSVIGQNSAGLVVVAGAGGGTATEAKQDDILEDLADIKGSGFVKDTDSLTVLAHSTEIAALNDLSAQEVWEYVSRSVTIAVGGIQAGSFSAGAINDAAVNADAEQAIANAVVTTVVESQDNITLQQALSVILSAVAGVTSSNGAALYSPNGLAQRIAATIDANNNRTGMTLTPSS